MTEVSKFVVGNWKMQASQQEGMKLASDLISQINAMPPSPVQTVICPSYTQLYEVHTKLKNQKIATKKLDLGAQDCFPIPKGPYTGDISAKMLVEIGAKYVILGHSERRKYHNETNAIVQEKVKAATAAGLTPIVCVGEHLTERNAGRSASVLAEQIEGSLARDFNGMIAYEPVWAIGSGIMPSKKELTRKISLLRSLLTIHLIANCHTIPILYGGSVTAKLAPAIFSLPELGGVLVGSASLNADGFTKIIKAAADSISKKQE